MLVSHGATSAAALVVLIAINALANGSAIALARDAACKRREVAARGAATRARRRQAPTRTPTEVTYPRETVPERTIVPVPRWHPAVDDVVDAEILS